MKITRILLSLITIIIVSAPVLAKENEGHILNVCNTTTPNVMYDGTEHHIKVRYAFPGISNQVGVLAKAGDCHSYTFRKNVEIVWGADNFWNESFLGSKGVRKIFTSESGTTTINFLGQYEYGFSDILIEDVKTELQ